MQHSGVEGRDSGGIERRRPTRRGSARLAAAAGSGQGCGGQRVVALGGGPAGLTAGYRLMNEGYDVILREGQDRVGGRVLTVRDGFQAGAHRQDRQRAHARAAA